MDFHLRSHRHSVTLSLFLTQLCREEHAPSLHTWKGGVADARIKNSKAAGLPAGGRGVNLVPQEPQHALAFSDGL